MSPSDFTVNSPKLIAFSEENGKNKYEDENKVIENEYMVKNIKSYKKIEKIDELTEKYPQKSEIDSQQILIIEKDLQENENNEEFDKHKKE